LDTDYNQTQWGGVITKENLEELGKKIKASVPQAEIVNYGSDLIEGFNNLNLDVNDILKVLENGAQYFKGKYLTCIGKTEWDALNWNDSSIAEKKTIINTADIVFTAAENVEKFNNGRNKLKESNVNSLLLDCSDAHNNTDSTDKDRIGNCNTWIKADTTFEGLKQIVYEPEERVKIQESKPDDKSVYQVIDSVELNEENFWKGKICLNENLNTIIGGRSTGKSTLLKSIAKKIDNKAEIDTEKDFIHNHLSGVIIKWKDGEDGIDRDIDFFRQSYMHDIAKDKAKTDELIKKIISNKDENKLLIEFENQNNELKKSISKNILDAFQLQTDIEKLLLQSKEKGDKKGVETEIQRLETKITELSKNSTISDSEIAQYQVSQHKIAEAESLVSQAENDLQLFPIMKITTVIKNSYPNEYGFDNLSFLLNRDELYRYFKNLTIETDKKWKEIVELFEKSTGEKKNIHINTIEQEKQTEIYKKGTQYYSDNKELNDIQNKLKGETNKLQEIRNIEEKINRLKSRKEEIITNIVSEHTLYNSNAQKLVQSLQIEHEGVKITTISYCKKQEIKSFLESKLNQRGNDRQQYINELVENYENNLANYSKNFLVKALNKEIDYKQYNTYENVVREFFTTNWFDISFLLFYQDDDFDAMSQGKQALVILKLLLEFSTKECPILIDQPEDSLDNRAIYNELVQYLKTKKKQRQIILVTHNPNVVVSADAENVIVANQNGKNCLNKDDIKFQ
jgi:ABC-type cobalamin/Fe3+-siderophores transport system ATPase subunit